MLTASGRALFTFIMWVLLIGAMIPLTAITIDILQEAVIAIPVVLAVSGIAVTGFIYNWGQLPNESSHDASSESFKRNRLTMALRDLSDSELASLRQRLASGDIDDDQLARLLDESDASKAKRH